MGYATGTSTAPSDLLSDLVSFLSGEGWSITRTNGYRDGVTDDQVTIHDSSATDNPFFHFLYDDDTTTARIDCQPSVSDAGISSPYYAHTGSPNTSGGNGTTVSIGQRGATSSQGFEGASQAYHFFGGSTSDGRYCHVVVEGDAGVFFHLLFGTIEKAGTFGGGAYMTAMQTRQDGQVMWPFCGSPGNWYSTQWLRCDDVLTGGSYTTDGGTSYWSRNFGTCHYFRQNPAVYYSMPWYCGGLIAYNQRSVLGPNPVVVWEDAVPGLGDDHAILGHIPDCRPCSMFGREPNEIITIGSDDWHIFPVHQKLEGATGTSTYTNTNTGTAPNNFSNYAGFAYLEN